MKVFTDIPFFTKQLIVFVAKPQIAGPLLNVHIFEGPFGLIVGESTGLIKYNTVLVKSIFKVPFQS